MKHLYTSNCDTVIATSIKNAEKVWEDVTGDPFDICDGDDEFNQIPDDHLVEIRFELDGGKVDCGETVIPRCAIRRKDVENGFLHIQAPAAAWAKSNKRQILCSTEW